MSNEEEKIQEFNRTLNIGHGNYIMLDRVVSILEPHSMPVKRLRDRAESYNKLIDATAGRKTRSVIVTDSNHVILAAQSPQTLQSRWQQKKLSVLEWQEGEFAS